jgi:hypothetical protein
MNWYDMILYAAAATAASDYDDDDDTDGDGDYDGDIYGDDNDCGDEIQLFRVHEYKPVCNLIATSHTA